MEPLTSPRTPPFTRGADVAGASGVQPDAKGNLQRLPARVDAIRAQAEADGVHSAGSYVSVQNNNYAAADLTRADNREKQCNDIDTLFYDILIDDFFADRAQHSAVSSVINNNNVTIDHTLEFDLEMFQGVRHAPRSRMCSRLRTKLFKQVCHSFLNAMKLR